MLFLSLTLCLLQLSPYFLFLLCSKLLKRAAFDILKCLHLTFSICSFTISLEPYSKHHSTESGFMKVTGELHGVTNHVDSQAHILVAFNMTDHPLLPERLSALGLGIPLF